MINKKNKKKIIINPIITMMILILLVIIFSTIFSLLNIGGSITLISNDNLETSLVTIRNILTPSGVRHYFENIFIYFSQYKMFLYLVVSLLGFGVCEKSGLFDAMFDKIKKIKPSIITFITLLISVGAGVFGEGAYAIVIPFVALMYKHLNRNPFVGVITSFLGLSVGYATNFVYNYNEMALGLLTQASAIVDVDKDFVFNLTSNLYISIFSGLLVCFVGTVIIEKFLAPKFVKRVKITDEDEKIYSTKALFFTKITFITLVLLLLYMIIPGYPGSGLLLNIDGNTYVEKLWNSSAFNEGFVYIFSLMISICGLVYGFISKNFTSIEDFAKSFDEEFKEMGHMFILFFLTSQLIGIITYTRFDQVIVGRLVEFLSVLEFSGIPLIIITFIITILITIIMPSTLDKWKLMSPLIIPLFMRSNITPEFTQMLFKIADGLGKCISPLFGGFVVMIVFAQKYNKEKENVGVFNLLNKMKSTIIMFIVLWVLIIAGWYIVGLPLGSSVYATL